MVFYLIFLGFPFWAYALTAAASKAYLITGTANGGYGTIDCTAFVPEYMKSARQEGHDVIASINCGSFRRKDHCRPYGLSIRNGIETAFHLDGGGSSTLSIRCRGTNQNH